MNDTNDHTSNIPEPGTYRAKAIEWRWDTAKSGDPCLAILFELTSGQPGFQMDGRLYFDTEKQDAKGRTAMDRSMEALAAMGLQGEALTAEMTGIDQGEVDLVTEVNDKGYLTVKWINAPRTKRELRTFAEPAPPALNAFLAKVNGRARAVASSSRAAGTTPMAAQAARAPAKSAAASQARRSPPAVQGMGASEFGADEDIPF